MDVRFAGFEKKSHVVEGKPEIASELSLGGLVLGISRGQRTENDAVIDDQPSPLMH